MNEIFNFHNDIINSSVYAISLLKSSDEVNEEMWQIISEEFYHCPFFRSQHSFWLFEKNENLKGIAKLINTAKEFPWYKEAVINASSSILQFRQQANLNDIWDEELNHLNGLIEANGWR